MAPVRGAILVDELGTNPLGEIRIGCEGVTQCGVGGEHLGQAGGLLGPKHRFQGDGHRERTPGGDELRSLVRPWVGVLLQPGDDLQRVGAVVALLDP